MLQLRVADGGDADLGGGAEAPQVQCLERALGEVHAAVEERGIARGGWGERRL